MRKQRLIHLFLSFVLFILDFAVLGEDFDQEFANSPQIDSAISASQDSVGGVDGSSLSLLMDGLPISPDPLSAAVAVVACANDPESRLLAKVYQKFRALDDDQLVFLACTGGEDVSRESYESNFLQPLTRFKKSHPEIRFLVTARGMPKRILPTKKQDPYNPDYHFSTDAASFESELAEVGQPFSPHAGWIKSKNTLSPENQKWQVYRLDGKSVRSIVNVWKASAMLQELGPTGELCIDTTGAANLSPIFDEWEERPSARSLFPVLLSKKTHSTCTEAVIAVGGSDLDSLASPMPGAIWWDIADANFKKPVPRPLELLDGVAFQWWAAWPTYRSSWPDSKAFLIVLLTGARSVGEAMEMAKFSTSWMLSPLGDPLYRPFKNKAQLSESEAETLLGFPIVLENHRSPHR